MEFGPSESWTGWQRTASASCIVVALIGWAGCLVRQRTVVQVPELPAASRMSPDAVAPTSIDPTHRVLLTSSSTVAPLAANVQTRPWRYIVLHHSGAPTGSVASIDRDHRGRRDSAGRPWRGIGYHFVIGNGRDMPDGEIQPTFRWSEQLAGAHAGKSEFNEVGIGICLIGNFDETTPTQRQMQACRKLVAGLRDELRLSADSIVRHSDVKVTECPGKNFSIEAVLVADQHAAALILETDHAH